MYTLNLHITCQIYPIKTCIISLYKFGLQLLMTHVSDTHSGSDGEAVWESSGVPEARFSGAVEEARRRQLRGDPHL